MPLCGMGPDRILDPVKSARIQTETLRLLVADVIEERLLEGFRAFCCHVRIERLNLGAQPPGGMDTPSRHDLTPKPLGGVGMPDNPFITSSAPLSCDQRGEGPLAPRR